MIGSVNLRTIIRCNHHSPLVVSLAKEVLLARLLRKACGEWLEYYCSNAVRKNRKLPPVFIELDKVYNQYKTFNE